MPIVCKSKEQCDILNYLPFNSGRAMKFEIKKDELILSEASRDNDQVQFIRLHPEDLEKYDEEPRSEYTDPFFLTNTKSKEIHFPQTHKKGLDYTKLFDINYTSEIELPIKTMKDHVYKTNGDYILFRTKANKLEFLDESMLVFAEHTQEGTFLPYEQAISTFHLKSLFSKYTIEGFCPIESNPNIKIKFAMGGVPLRIEFPLFEKSKILVFIAEIQLLSVYDLMKEEIAKNQSCIESKNREIENLTIQIENLKNKNERLRKEIEKGVQQDAATE